MPSLKDYFTNDAKGVTLDWPLDIKIHDKVNPKFQVGNLSVPVKVWMNLNMNCRLITFYIPASQDTFQIINFLLENIETSKTQAIGLSAYSKFPNDISLGPPKAVFSNTVIFYHETMVGLPQLDALRKYAEKKDINVLLRSDNYLQTRLLMDKPQAFISHDSRDKELIAKPLAHGLSSRMCTVWYDEFSLKIGDRLRDSIQKGIREANKCILILTKNYLNNLGWTKEEFESIFTRELVMQEKVILPIWYGVTKQDVYEYSTSLPDSFALTWPSTEGKSEDAYSREVQQLISKVHAAVAGMLTTI